MTPLSYLNENSLRRYPFRDDVSLTSQEAFTLSNGLFLDLQILANIPNTVEAYLSRLTINSHLVTFEFTFLDKNLTPLLIFNFQSTVTQDKQLITHQTSGGDIVRLIAGIELVSLSGSNGDYTFHWPNTAVSTSALILPRPLVNTITFKNYDDSTVNTTSPNSSLNIGSGSNVNLNTPGLSLTVVPGGGTGLFDACADLPTDVVRRINKIGPNSKGNFNIRTGPCMSSDVVTNGATFKHTCDPRCNEDQVSALAYYSNRIKSGLLIINTYATSIKHTLDALEIAYRDNKLAVAGKAVPYILAEVNTTSAPPDNFYSVSAAIFDPRKNSIQVDMEVDFPLSMHYVNDTAKLTTNGVVQKLTGQPGFTDHVVPCKNGSLYSFVLQSPATNHDQTIQLIGNYPQGSVYKALVVSPGIPYFNSRYSNFKDGSLYTVYVTIDLLDPNNSHLNTTLTITLPSGLVFSANSDVLNINGTSSTHNTLGFTSVSIDYSHSASYAFRATKTGNSSGLITVNMNTGSSSFTEDIPIFFNV